MSTDCHFNACICHSQEQIDNSLVYFKYFLKVESVPLKGDKAQSEVDFIVTFGFSELLDTNDIWIMLLIGGRLALEFDFLGFILNFVNFWEYTYIYIKHHFVYKVDLESISSLAWQFGCKLYINVLFKSYFYLEDIALQYTFWNFKTVIPTSLIFTFLFYCKLEEMRLQGPTEKALNNVLAYVYCHLVT